MYEGDFVHLRKKNQSRVIDGLFDVWNGILQGLVRAGMLQFIDNSSEIQGGQVCIVTKWFKVEIFLKLWNAARTSLQVSELALK